MNAAVAQMGQFYNLPVYNSSGLTDSKIPDAQAGYEKGITGLAAALAGELYPPFSRLSGVHAHRGLRTVCHR